MQAWASNNSWASEITNENAQWQGAPIDTNTQTQYSTMDGTIYTPNPPEAPPLPPEPESEPENPQVPTQPQQIDTIQSNVDQQSHIPSHIDLKKEKGAKAPPKTSFSSKAVLNSQAESGQIAKPEVPAQISIENQLNQKPEKDDSNAEVKEPSQGKSEKKGEKKEVPFMGMRVKGNKLQS